jgi:ankyrin repeat protein
MVKDKLFLDEHQDGRFPSHLALKRDNAETSDNLNGLSEEAQINADNIRSTMMLARDKSGKTAWQLAVINERIMVLQKFLDLAREIRPGEVRNTLLLDNEADGRHAWFLAAKTGNVKVLEELWSLAKEKGNPKPIKSKLLLAQNQYGQTALHVAAEGSVAVLQKLRAFAKEAQLNEDELKNKLLLAKDKYGYKAWHRAAEGGSSKALETLWSWANEAEINPDELLLDQNEEGETVLHLAAKGNHIEIIEKLDARA